MLEERKYTINELIEAVAKTDFKPKKGESVDSENKKNNKEAVDEIVDETEATSLKKVMDKQNESSVNQIEDRNKTTLDYRFDVEPSDEYKERVASQVKGFPSKENEENTSAKENESLDYDGNQKFYDAQKEKSDEENEKDMTIRHSGLAARTMPKEQFKNKTLYKENKMKRLHFKHTTFLSESQMLQKVPEDYKVDGNVFLMKDASGTEYMVECKKDEKLNYTQMVVLKRQNKEEINEEFSKIKHLYEYRTSDYMKGNETAKNEGISEMLNKVKSLVENKQK